MKSLMNFVAAFAVCVIAGATAGAQTVSVGLTTDYKLVSFGSGNQTSIVVAFGIRNVEGKIALCGAYFLPAPSASSTVPRQMLRDMKFAVGGKSLRTRAGHFNRIKDIATGCRSTRLDWRDGLKTGSVKLTSKNVRFLD